MHLGKVLCIPTTFHSYNGEALDKKRPLINSCKAINTQVLRLLNKFGDDKTKKIIINVGAEQEYFLIDKDLYKKRTDLAITGRTLFGARPSKTQQLNDHYLGAIKEDVAVFMTDVENNLLKLGIICQTKHNEVAPCQYELVPYYTDVNLSTDHNHLIMETLKNIAEKHNFVCLLHEKPFENINGSGKHNNWSLSTLEGKNLLSPGKTPVENARFLTIFTAIVTAVDEYADLLRASTANATNDHRLSRI